MKKEVIALWGKGKVGKSQTIRKTYDLLKSKYNITQEKHNILSRIDVSVVLTIKRIKVGVESRGDPDGKLPKRLSSFVRAGCKIIICATRTRGKNVEAIDKLRLKNYEVVLWLKQNVKSVVSRQQESNNAMAKEIVREIEKTIYT